MTVSRLVEFLLYFVVLPPFVLVIFDSVCRLVFLVVTHMPLRVQPRVEAPNNHRLMVLVVARDEEKAIEETLRLLKKEMPTDASSHVAVLADHCSDRTASIAAQMGALVLARSEGHAGKAEALSWFVSNARELLSQTDVIALLDADSRVEAGFFKAIQIAFRPDVKAVQGFVNPVSNNGFPLTTLVSFSEILSQKIDDVARSRLRWSVPLRGTAMAFRTAIFMKACEQLATQVDDIELSVRLAELGVPVLFEPSIVIDDPKSDRALGLAKQRGRWLRGQRQVWRTKGLNIIKLLRAGLENWSLIQALLLKPKTAFVAIRTILALLLWLWPYHDEMLSYAMFWVVIASLVADAIYYLSGLTLTSKPGKYLASLLASPVLLFLWALSWGYSLVPTQEWLRSDDPKAHCEARSTGSVKREER